MAEFGEVDMQREFAAWVRSQMPTSIVDGWTVTISTRTDDAEQVARERLVATLDSIPSRAMRVFE